MQPDIQEIQNRPEMPDVATIPQMPIGFQEIEKYASTYKNFNPTEMRIETIKRIQAITERPLICFVAQISDVPDFAGPITAISDSDVEGFDTLIDGIVTTTDAKAIDVFCISNGGSAEAAERIIRLLRENFEEVRFILPSNAYSAATMMAFACDEILMTDSATLGPIDPQINGIPARTIIRGFEELERRIKSEGPHTLGAYIHLLKDYSLHLIEFCKSAEELSKELAKSWLSDYMLEGDDENKIQEIVEYFANYDLHKSHARSIGHRSASEKGLKIQVLKRRDKLTKLIRSLNDQTSFFFRITDFYKLYENSYGISWGRRARQLQIEKSPQSK